MQDFIIIKGKTILLCQCKVETNEEEQTYSLAYSTPTDFIVYIILIDSDNGRIIKEYFGL